MSAQPLPHATPAKPAFPATVLFVAALSLFLLGSLGAWLQPPRLFPLQPLSAAGWWLYPVEQNAFQRLPRIGGNLNDVFVTPDTGEIWAVGDKGLIVHSQDGGRSWTQADITANPPSPAFSQTPGGELPAGGAPPNLAAIFFAADSQRGWAVGDKGALLTSNDGGQSWSPQASGTEENLADVAFAANGQRGWAVGGNGTIIASADGGETWNTQASGTLEHLNGVAFTADGLRGWVVGGDGTALASSDGGRSWKPNAKEAGRGLWLSNVAFAGDGQSGLAVGGGGTILASNDGGRSWTPSPIERLNSRLNGVFFAADGQRGWAVGENGTILASSDNGRSWSPQASGTHEHLKSVAFAADSQHGWAVGNKGTILASSDGGRNWSPQASGSEYFSDVAFAADSQHGWAVGSNGMILTSTDNGQSWNLQASKTNEYLEGVAFTPDGQRGWLVGRNGTILASSDGGRNWNPQASGTDTTLWGVAFAVDGLRGWAVGNDNTILTTTDSGRNWNRHTSAAQADLFGVTFAADGQHGWMAGRNGTILASTDGGRSWNPQASGTTQHLFSIAFASDRQHGWAVGKHGTILASTDGGRNWNPQTSGTDADLYGVTLLGNGLYGWATGQKLTLLTTADGGKTWLPAPYHRYPAPWYWPVCLLAVILASLGTRKPQEGQKEVSVADMLASDRPLQSGDADPLNYADIAAGVSRFLRNPKTLPPLTVAVTGEWGSGKSSLMNLLREDLRRAGFTTVWFNAWHHQKGEQLLASLFANIRAQAIPPWLSRSGLEFRWNLLRLRSLRHSLLLIMLLMLFSGSLAYLYADFGHFKQLLAAERWSQLKINTDSLKAMLPLFGGFGVLVTALISFFTAINGFGLDPAKLIATVSSGVAQRKPIEPGARYEFAKEFADVAKALAPGRLVVFIDDLDRCSKENVLEVLECVNFLVSSGDCFIILGMAREWVETCVGLGFKELAEEHNYGADEKIHRVEFARKYLQKLINIEVPLPKMDAGGSLRLLPDEKAWQEPGNRLASWWEGAWSRLWQYRHALLLLGFVAFGAGWGRWLAPQIGQDLDWVSVKINRAAELNTPLEEIQLPSAFDLKLVEANGGAVNIGLTPKPPDSAGKPDMGGGEQLLLRASAEALEKGLVLGKLGDQDNAAELVLKRRKAAPSEFVGPLQEPAGAGQEPGRRPETHNYEGPVFTSGAADVSPLRALAWTAPAGLLLALGLMLLLRSPVNLAQDSDAFVQALKTWHPLIAASCPTPRMVKRYLNWVRFLAMRYRPREKDVPRVWPPWPLRKQASAAKSMAPREDKAFDEHILVALSAIYQFRKEWVLDLAKFEQLKNGRIGMEFFVERADAQNKLDEMEQNIKQTEDLQAGFARNTAAERPWQKAVEYKFVAEAFASLTPTDWQKAAEQRSRFIEAVGDVEVA